MKDYKVLFPLFVAGMLIVGCKENSTAYRQAQDRIDRLESKLQSDYTPGWGEIMRGSIQVHHSNLWFAGEAENWELAEHIVEELEEGFEKLQTWHPNDVETASIPMVDKPLRNLAEVINNKDKVEFKKGYLALTHSCNTCHATTGNEIYVIQTPTSPGFTNQSFKLQ
jgi:hypothetical protein